MTFVEAVKTVFGKYVDFDGRARRSEFWYYILFVFILDAVIQVLGWILGAKLGNTLLTLVSLAILLPTLGVSVRRLHDVGRGGWWILLELTVIGTILLIFWWAQDSQAGDNEFGPNPKVEAARSEAAQLRDPSEEP